MLGLGLSFSKQTAKVFSFVRDQLKLLYRFYDNSPELLLSGATSFNGTNNSISISDSDSLSFGDGSNDSAFSISAWINMDDATNFVIVSKGTYNVDAEYRLYSHGSDILTLELFDGEAGSTYEIAGSTSAITSYEGKWTHVACTYTGVGGTSANTGIKLYINGSEIAVSLVTGGNYDAMGNLGANVQIGSSATGSAFSDGSIANVGIWNRALSLSEIESIYWKGQYADLKGTELTNLVSWYNLKDTGYGSEIVTGTDSDMSGSNNWATQLGSPTFNVNSTVADRLYINFSSGNQSVKLPNVFTPSLAYKVTLKARLNSGTATTVQFGSEFTSGSVSGIGKNIIPSSTLTEYTVDITSASTADLCIGIINALNNGSDYEFVDVKVQEVVSPDSTGTNNGSIYGATTLTDAYSASSPFLPRIQDKATPKGAVALASGSTSFDGSNDYISFPFQESGSYTISAWFKLDVAQTSIVVNWGDQATGERRSLLIWNGGSGGYHVYSSTYGSNIAGSTVLSTGVWYHASVTVDVSDGSAKIYLNGSLDGSGTNTINSFTGTTGEIGRQPDGEYFEGSLANVAIYSDVKTQSQIQDIMFSSYSTLTSALKTNLVSWYDLGSTGLSSNKYNSTSGWTAYGNNTIQVNGLDFDITYVDNGNGIFGRYNNNILTSNVLAGAKYEVSFDAFYTGGSAPIVRYYTDAYTTIATLTTESTNYKYIHTPVDSTNDFINFKTNSGNVVSVKNFSFKEIQATDSQGTNEGSIYGATTNTGYTSSPSGVADPLNYGEVYGGNAVSFDGTNDYVNIVNSVEWQKPKTISMWFKATSISSHGSNVYNKDTLIGYANLYWAIQLDVNKKIQYFYYDGSLRSWLTDSTITLGKWHHIAVVSDGDSSQIFLDGQSIGSNSLTWDDVTIGVDKQLKLGGTGGGFATQPFTGSMSHVQVFSEALTQDQVRELYTKPELTLPTGIASSALKLDMPMQEGSGTAILDGSGNQNHGTGSGITWATGQEYGFQHPLVRSNNPMVFDGADDKVAVGTPSALNNIFTGGGTLSAWINPKSDGQNNAGQAFDKSKYAFQVISESSGNVKVQFAVTLSGGAARWETPLSVPLNTWTHILVTYDSDNPTTDPIIYLNGSAVTLTETISPSGTHVSDASSNLILGNRNDGVTTFDGLLNDLAIWDSALTANEVTALYNSGLPLLPTTDSGNYASSDDLVGYWRNDGVTTWTDRSTNSNNGTVSGSPASIIVPEGLNEGRDSQGYYLTDTDSISSGIRLKGAEYIDIGKSEAYPFKGGQNLPFSVEAWVKVNDLTALNGVIGNSGECFYIRLFSNGRIEAFLKGSGGGYIKQEVSSVTSAGWHHLCVTYDGSGNRDNINIFWDSTEQSNAPSSSGTYTSLATTANNLQIGTINGGSYFGGSLDEIKIYDKVLSNAEILKNYNNGKSAHSN